MVWGRGRIGRGRLSWGVRRCEVVGSLGNWERGEFEINTEDSGEIPNNGLFEMLTRLVQRPYNVQCRRFQMLSMWQ